MLPPKLADGLGTEGSLPWIIHGLTPELVPPYPVKPGFSKCLCLHNAYYTTYPIACQFKGKIGNIPVDINEHQKKYEKDTTIITDETTENIVDYI
jgi:hypothetical protein